VWKKKKKRRIATGGKSPTGVSKWRLEKERIRKNADRKKFRKGFNVLAGESF